jgi:hypothetical protein
MGGKRSILPIAMARWPVAKLQGPAPGAVKVAMNRQEINSEASRRLPADLKVRQPSQPPYIGRRPTWYTAAMNLIVRIPDDVAERLAADGGDLERQALEALVAEAYRAGRMTRPELRRLLGFETGHEIDGFLQAHDIYDGIASEELSRQLETLDRLEL